MSHYGLISTEELSLLQPLFNSPWMEKPHNEKEMTTIFQYTGSAEDFLNIKYKSLTFLYWNMTLVNREFEYIFIHLQVYKFLANTFFCVCDGSVGGQIAKVVCEFPMSLGLCCDYIDWTLLYFHTCRQMSSHDCNGLFQFQTVQFQQRQQQRAEEDTFCRKYSWSKC